MRTTKVFITLCSFLWIATAITVPLLSKDALPETANHNSEHAKALSSSASAAAAPKPALIPTTGHQQQSHNAIKVQDEAIVPDAGVPAAPAPAPAPAFGDGGIGGPAIALNPPTAAENKANDVLNCMGGCGADIVCQKGCVSTHYGTGPVSAAGVPPPVPLAVSTVSGSAVASGTATGTTATGTNGAPINTTAGSFAVLNHSKSDCLSVMVAMALLLVVW